MKKIIIFIFCILVITGCNTLDISNTPTKKVEAFLNNYQILHEDVLKDLDNTIKEENILDDINSEEYRKLIKNQYNNMQYSIKEELIDADKATVTAEIIVKDFTKIIKESQLYKQENPEKFYENEIYNVNLYQKYLIEKLKESNERVTYTLKFKLHKDNGKWVVDPIDEEIEDKMLGIYNY